MNNLAWLSWPGHAALAKPRLALVLLVALLAIGAFHLPRLSFDADIKGSFASSDSHVSVLNGFLQSKEAPPAEIIMLASSRERFSVSDYETLRNLVLELELVEGVGSVFSVAALRFPLDHPRFAEQPVLPLDLDRTAIDERLQAAQKAGLRPFVSQDQKHALVAISLAKARSPNEIAIRLADVKKLVSEFGGSQLTYLFTGEELIGPEVVSALKRDLLIMNLMGCLMAVVTAWFVLGQWRLVVLAAVPALAAAFMAVSLFPIVGLKLTVLSNVVPILILVLALADSIHLALHFRDHRTESGGASKTLTAIGPACALTAITTAIAFGAISFTDNDQLRELALAGAASVLIAYCIVVATFALLANAMRLPESKSPQRFGGSLYVWLVELVQRRAALLRFMAVPLLVGVIASAAYLKPWFNLADNLPITSKTAQASSVIEREFGGFFRLWIELPTKGTDALSGAQGWRALVDLTQAVEKAAPGSPVFSLATVARFLGRADRMPTSEDLEQIPPGLKRQLISADGSVARLLVFVPEPMSSEATKLAHDALEKAAYENGASRLIGVPMVIRHGSLRVVSELAIGLGIACLLVTVLVAAACRWFALAPVLLLPNLLPLGLTAASLHFLNQGLVTPVTLLAMTVAFGIAVDDSIHFINRYLLARDEGAEKPAAIRLAIGETGQAMLVTTLVICVGAGVTLFSGFAIVQLFGVMLILTFVTALFADLLLLPALLMMKGMTR